MGTENIARILKSWGRSPTPAQVTEKSRWRDERLAAQAHKRAKNPSRVRGYVMAKSKKVIVTCAVTGSIHTPSMSPHLPVTATEIEGAAVGAIEAGAAIAHLHARDPNDGRPSQRVVSSGLRRQHQAPHQWRHQHHHGCAQTMTVEERLQPRCSSGRRWLPQHGFHELRPAPDAREVQDFRHDWEAKYLEATRDRVFRNTFRDIEYILRSCSDNGTRFEFECYDTAHLYNLAHFVDRGLVKAPMFVQTVFGILGGIGTHADDVAHMKRTADRLFGDQYQWSVLMTIPARAEETAKTRARTARGRKGHATSPFTGSFPIRLTNFPASIQGGYRHFNTQFYQVPTLTNRAIDCKSSRGKLADSSPFQDVPSGKSE